MILFFWCKEMWDSVHSLNKPLGFKSPDGDIKYIIVYDVCPELNFGQVSYLNVKFKSKLGQPQKPCVALMHLAHGMLKIMNLVFLWQPY